MAEIGIVQQWHKKGACLDASQKVTALRSGREVANWMKTTTA